MQGSRSAVPFIAAVAVSSAALFMVQPMAARMLLPYLGGAPSVWTTCMLFFQAGLLAGYLHAHASGWLGLRAHAVLHVVLVGLACFFLPLEPEAVALQGSGESPVYGLLANLFRTLGLPYFVLAATAPLLQVWFARSGTPSAKDPYFLYAASNAGSLVGLLAYPLLIEPRFSLSAQRSLWSGVFLLFMVLTLFCAFALRKAERPGKRRKEASRRSAAAKGHASPGMVDLLKWLFLAFVPASLLLSITAHLAADVGSLPLLWVVPLCVYLITYIIAFSPRAADAQPFWNRWLPLVLLVLVIVLITGATEPLLVIVLLNLLGLFWIGMACHASLAAGRPAVAHLTSFYLTIAVGGALGGVFNALLAPAIFTTVAEFPIGLVLACLVPIFASSQLSGANSSMRQRWMDLVLPAALVAFTLALAWMVERLELPFGRGAVALTFAMPLLGCYLFSARPLRFALGIAGLLMIRAFHPVVGGVVEKYERSFFGVHRLVRQGEFRVLYHGNTEHGRQSLDPARAGDPLSYYGRSGPVGDLFRSLDPADPRLRKVAVLGLGAGALAAYSRAGQQWDFYEIDPAVIRLARTDFTYLADASARGAAINTVLGDARIQIGNSKERYGLIILDVFSSDLIPSHLFTKEALTVYRQHLTPDGLLLIHYSNRYYELLPVLESLARSADPPLSATFCEHLELSDNEWEAGAAPSKWALLTQAVGEPVLFRLARRGWYSVGSQEVPPAWTDDHANVLGALEFLKRE